MQQKINTISCPCSSYAITNTNGTVSCERDNFGKIEYVAPVVLQNHLINGSAPAVGDKWSCGGAIKCGNTGFSWNTLHVVSVSGSDSESNSSLVNTTSSTSNCYIPKSSLRDYDGKEMSEWERTLNTYGGDGEIDGNIIKEFDGLPAFNNAEAAKLYQGKIGAGTQEFSVVNDGGSQLYVPGKYYGDEGLITGITVNGKDVFSKQVGLGFSPDALGNSLSKSKIVIPSSGGTLDVRIISEGSKGAVNLKLRDSTDCNIFNTNKDNQSINKGLALKQVIPPLGLGKSQEVYTLKILPTAGTRYYMPAQDETPSELGSGQFEVKVWQFKNPTITLDTIASTIANSTTTSTTKTLTGAPNSTSEETVTHVTTIANASEYSNVFYNTKEKLDLADLITDSSVIKKMVLNTPSTPEALTSIQAVDSGDTYRGDIIAGMKFSGSYSETKTLQKSVALHIEEECDDCDKELDILTDKFEFENVNELLVGMQATWVDDSGYPVESKVRGINGGVEVTLDGEYIIDEKTEVTFTYYDSGLVTEVNGDTITVASGVWFPKNQEITFTRGGGSGIKGTVVVDKSGADTMVITTTINSITFGQEDAAIALDVDRFVSLTPNTVETKVVTTKDNPVSIDLVAEDTDYNSREKGYVIVEPTRNGELVVKSAGLNTYVYTPNPGFKGLDEFTYRTTTGNGESLVEGEERTISIKIK